MILHTLPRTALLTGLIAMLITQSVSAQAPGTDMSLSLAPHCTIADRSACPAFSVADGTHLTTATLAAGDILDIDVVVTGPQYAEVETIESWLKYDPTIL